MSNGSTFVSAHCWANNVCQFDLSLRKQNWNFFTFVINSNQTFIPQIYRVMASFGEKLDILSPRGLKLKRLNYLLVS